MSDRHANKVKAIKERRDHFVQLEQRALFLLKVLLVVIAIFMVADWVMPFLNLF